MYLKTSMSFFCDEISKFGDELKLFTGKKRIFVSSMPHAEEKGSGRSILKIIVGIVWVAVNVIIFVLAPIFIVSIILSFGIPLNMPIVFIIYTLGFIAVGFSGLMSWYEYGTRERAITALCYTGVVIGFLLIVLTHLGGGFAEIRLDLAGITLRADIALFSYIILTTMVVFGVIYAIELLAVFREMDRKIYSYLKAGSVICICFFLITASFFMIVAGSATRIGGFVEDPPIYTYNTQGTIPIGDDTLDITYNFTINNAGLFKMSGINFTLYLWVNDSNLLTPGTLLGTGQKTIPSIKRGEVYQDTLTVGIDAAYIILFIASITNILTKAYISATVASLLPVSVNITFYSHYDPSMLISL